MSLETQLMEDMKSALKSGDKIRLETIRGLRSQLKNEQIARGRELREQEVVQVLNSAAKKRREAMAQYSSVGRTDRADLEAHELSIIEGYLPEQMDAAAITAVVDSVITKVSATSMKDIGAVMGAVMPLVRGKADGKIVQQIVREKLSVK